MPLRKLNNYGLVVTGLRVVSREFNEAGITNVTPIDLTETGINMLRQFLNAYDDVPDDCMNEIPEEVNAYYKSVPQAVFDEEDSGEGVGAGMRRKHTTPVLTKTKEGRPRRFNIRTRYGHWLGSMSETLDNLLWKGTTEAEMVYMLGEVHKRDKQHALSKIARHIKHLTQDLGIVVTDTNGHLKTDREYAEGRNADNTLLPEDE